MQLRCWAFHSSSILFVYWIVAHLGVSSRILIRSATSRLPVDFPPRSCMERQAGCNTRVSCVAGFPVIDDPLVTRSGVCN
jgi:hypothetical protein